MVAYLPGSDEKHSILLQNLATKGRAASPIFYTISRIQSAIGEFKEEGIYFVNKNAEEGDMVSKFGASLDDEITHLTDNLIMHFEAESLPLVLDFTSDVFGRVFTGSISVISNLHRLNCFISLKILTAMLQIMLEIYCEKYRDTIEQMISSLRGLYLLSTKLEQLLI